MMWLAMLAGEIVGIIALLGISFFTVTYSRNSNWRLTRPGRAVMYLARGLVATFALLVFWSFVNEPMEIRWIVEVMVYGPLAWACWNMYFSLRETLRGKPTFLFLVPRKHKKEKHED